MEHSIRSRASRQSFKLGWARAQLVLHLKAGVDHRIDTGGLRGSHHLEHAGQVGVGRLAHA